MKGVCLRFYSYEHQTHHGILLHEWLLEMAKKNMIHGGSAFRGIAGYGRIGVLHEEHFFELGSNVPTETVFIMKENEAENFLTLLKRENLDLIYSKTAVEYGALNE